MNVCMLYGVPLDIICVRHSCKYEIRKVYFLFYEILVVQFLYVVIYVRLSIGNNDKVKEMGKNLVDKKSKRTVRSFSWARRLRS